MLPEQAIAHVATDGRIHHLREHLEGTARRAKEAGRWFGSAEWAEVAGLWHDLGKYAKAFQDMIRSANCLDAHVEGPIGRVDHSTAGALLAVQRYGDGGLPLAFVIAGHHAGLADMHDAGRPGGPRALSSRLSEKHLLGPVLAGVGKVAEHPVPTPPRFLRSLPPGQGKDDLKRSYEFWVRMLYSTLVDADFLDTEEFHEGGEAGTKPRLRGVGDSLAVLKTKFDAHMAAMQQAVTPAGSTKTSVNQTRDRVLQACHQRASDPLGVFSLTAPTGAGKTLAAMGFALEHALKNSLRRVIVVIPYTSIIEQNAREYRKVFGSENVIEHHASLDPKKETFRNRLACENWDAPVIVTTSVQFFESLLANRSSRCRKLHNVARSVVIFDEVQTLPVGHLIPIVDLLRELVRNYSVSVLLSTATQPALAQRSSGLSGHFPGFERITEIVPDLAQTFRELRRVEIHWPEEMAESVTWEDLASEVEAEPRVLAIVHKRDDARTLARLLPPNTLHLSALMCAAHRSRVLSRIRRMLRWTKGDVRVVSTQLVEAGVDLDFPVVYRAFGGFDSVAQAAGRCNREGRLPELGQVRVFVAPTLPPRGTPARAAQAARVMLAGNPALDPLSPEIFDRYFREVYFASPSQDEQGIQRERAAWKFKTVAETFSMIEDDSSEPVVVPYGPAVKRLEELRRLGPNRQRLRAIQPFVVTVYPQQRKSLEDAGALELVADTVLALRHDTHAHLYDNRFGLVLEGPFAMNPASQVV
jgi:CRISPR-associated endonuclease/helicase Cas3